MYAIGRMLQVVGLVIVGAGAVAGFVAEVREGTMWLLWGGGLVAFVIGTSIVRRGG